MQNQSRRIGALLAATMLATAVLTAGCQPQRPVRPVETPPPPIVEEALQRSQEVRSTIVGGEAPVPQRPDSLDPVGAQPGDTALNFPNADVRVVAKAVLGDILKSSYSVAPDAQGQVSLVTPGPVSRGSILSLFEAALARSNLALVPVASGFEIMTAAAAKARGPVAPGATGYGQEVLSLEFLNAEEFKKLVDSLLPGVITGTGASRNAVTLAGTTGQRASVRDLARQFDVNWLRSMSFALLVPQRTDARLIVPALDKLINAPNAPTRGLVRIITMDTLNGILAISGQRQYIDDVRRWVEVLDREGESAEPRLFVYRAQNGRSRDLANTINGAFGTGGDGGGEAAGDATGDLLPPAPGEPPSAGRPNPRSPEAIAANRAREAAGAAAGGTGDASPAGGGTSGAGLGGVSITSDEVNNAVVVFGTPQQYAVVEQALRQLDVPPAQVLIEAAITEVTLNDNLRFGVNWNYITGDVELDLGRTVPELPAQTGFSLFYQDGGNLTAALEALEGKTDINVVSAPKLMVLNNQTASLQVGDQVPILTQQVQGIDSTNSPLVNSVEYRDTGVILKVTPRVNAGGLVQLDIAQEVSSVASGSAGGITSPTISTRRISTTIAVQDGQVITLGGLFSDRRTFGQNGLPFLSRIPIIGGLLFGSQQSVRARTELLVILKPTVVRTLDDGRRVTEELRAKLRTLEPFRSEGTIP